MGPRSAHLGNKAKRQPLKLLLALGASQFGDRSPGSNQLGGSTRHLFALKARHDPNFEDSRGARMSGNASRTALSLGTRTSRLCYRTNWRAKLNIFSTQVEQQALLVNQPAWQSTPQSVHEGDGTTSSSPPAAASDSRLASEHRSNSWLKGFHPSHTYSYENS